MLFITAATNMMSELLAVMQGLMPNYVKVVPSIAIAFVSYEQVLFPLDLLLVISRHYLLLLLLRSSFLFCSVLTRSFICFFFSVAQLSCSCLSLPVEHRPGS